MQPLTQFNSLFSNFQKCWERTFPKEVKLLEDYILVEVPKEKRRSGFIIHSSFLVFITACILLFVFLQTSEPLPVLVSAILLSPIFGLYFYRICKVSKTTHIEVVTPEGERKKQKKETQERARQRELEKQDYELIFESPWYFRYPIALIILGLLFWFLDAQHDEINSVVLWLVGGLWGFVAAVMVREFLFLMVLLGIGYLLFKGVAALPVSVAIIIGAIIVALVLKR